MKKKIFLVSLLFFVAILFYWLKKNNRIYNNSLDLQLFSSTPVVYQGRIKPLDTLARNTLKIISEKESVLYQNKKISAVYWYLHLISGTQESFKIPIFRVTNKDLINFLGLKENKKFLFSVSDLFPHFQKIEKQAQIAQQKEQENINLGAFSKQVLKLKRSLNLFLNIKDSHNVFFDTKDLSHLIRRRQNFKSLEQVLLIPPSNLKSHWLPLVDSYLKLIVVSQSKANYNLEFSEETKQLTNFWRSSLAAFYAYHIKTGQDKKQFAEIFNNNIREIKKLNNNIRQNILKEIGVAKEILEEKGSQIKSQSEITDLFVSRKELSSLENLWEARYEKTNFEFFYNKFSPFDLCIFFYIIILLASAFSFLNIKGNKNLQKFSFYLLLLTFGLHSFAIFSRIYISNYPPITNLYSSAVFVSWIAIFFLLILELIHRMGISSFIASLIGIATLIIASNLSGDGDTLEMKQAVLDTKFWLSTHVITIAIGYSANFVLGFLCIATIFLNFFKKGLDKSFNKKIKQSIYGILAFALIFSIIGTILGGLWADDSWGRFWGWDPKENGALMIVLWDALLIHTLWGKLLSFKGFLALGIFSNVITAWSWFGTNLLGVGLHSYGFTSKGQMWLLLFVVSQLLIMLFGLMQKKDNF